MANTKLTDTQRVVLAAAAQREGGLVLPLPASLGSNRGKLAIILRSLLTRALIVERPILPNEELWRDSAELGRITLVLAAEGFKLMGIDPVEPVVDHPDSNLLVDETRDTAMGAKPATDGADGSKSSVKKPKLPKAGTRLNAIVAALSQARGASIAELMEATGWQAHSVRGAISGALKKKLGLDITSDHAEGGGRIYRIAAARADAA